jgi:hypothetical protein
MDEHDIIRAVFGAIAAATAVTAAFQVVNQRPEPTPMYTGHSGQNRLDEMLRVNNPVRVRNALRMSKMVFVALVELLVRFGLTGGTKYTPELRVAIFLEFVGTGNSVRQLAESFQVSKDTVTRCAAAVALAP